MTKYRTCVYIDGFNLYYAIKNIETKDNKNKPSWQWDIRYPSLRTLCLNKLDSFPDQKHTLEKIHYFTARVIPPDHDKDKGGRQDRYNIALAKEKVKPHYGEFVKRKNSSGGNVWKEKQSDVNLAACFLDDAWKDKYDYAVIISEDTDFCGVIKKVLKQFPDKIVDVWTVSEKASERVFEITRDPKGGGNGGNISGGASGIARDLKEVALCYHAITKDELRALPQIANKDYTGKSI